MINDINNLPAGEYEVHFKIVGGLMIPGIDKDGFPLPPKYEVLNEFTYNYTVPELAYSEHGNGD